MNIGLFIHPFDPDKPGGLGRSNFALAEALLEESSQHSYTVYVKGDSRPIPFDSYPNVEVVFMGNGPLWLTGARKLDRTLDAYVFFMPIIPLGFTPKKSIVIALDFAFLEIPPRTSKERLSSWFLYVLQARALRQATKVLTISEATRQSALKYFTLAPSKVETMHIGYMALSSEMKPILVPKKFFLFAGVLKERKNVANIIRAFALFSIQHPGTSLVITGRPEGPYYDSLVLLAHELGVVDAVRFVGYVSNGELAYLYSHAEALVFPSLLEGFGMPVLEAMHAGLPVITSNTGALAEVADDAALLVNPHSPSDIAQALVTLSHDELLRESLRVRGYARAAQFSWKKAAHRLLACMDAI